MDNSYTSLAEAITSLQREGFTADFNLCDAGVENKHKKEVHSGDDLNVIKYYRFEGMSDPDDNTVLYVIETNSGEKGLLMDAYGAYSGNVSKELMDKLKMSR